jgi:hypothetical protein
VKPPQAVGRSNNIRNRIGPLQPDTIHHRPIVSLVAVCLIAARHHPRGSAVGAKKTPFVRALGGGLAPWLLTDWADGQVEIARVLHDYVRGRRFARIVFSHTGFANSKRMAAVTQVKRP